MGRQAAVRWRSRRFHPWKSETVWLVAALAVAGGLHLGVAPDHKDESLLAAGFFVTAAVAQLGLAIALTRRPRRQALSGVLAVNVAVMLVWAVSRLFALPFSGHDRPEPVGVVDAVTVGLQFVTVILAARALRASAGASARRNARTPGPSFRPRLVASIGTLFLVSVFGGAAVGADPAGHEAPHGSVGHAHQGAGHGDGLPEHPTTGPTTHGGAGLGAHDVDGIFDALTAQLERDGTCGPAEPASSDDCRAERTPHR